MHGFVIKEQVQYGYFVDIIKNWAVWCWDRKWNKMTTKKVAMFEQHIPATIPTLFCTF